MSAKCHEPTFSTLNSVLCVSEKNTKADYLPYYCHLKSAR